MNKFLTTLLITTVPLSGGAAVVCYPAPEEAPLNSSFSLFVSDNDAWRKVPIYNVKVDEVVDARHAVRNSSMAYFDCNEPVKVRVVANNRRVNEVKVRPLSYGITPKVERDTIEFYAKPGNLMSIEVNGEIFDNLQLFVNPLDVNAPNPKSLKKLRKNKDFIYYGPGYYKVDSIAPRSGQTLYIAGGAVIDGRIVIRNAKDVKVCGRGMVYPHRNIGIYTIGSENVEIEGLFTTQCAVGSSRGVKVTNVKVMSYYGWGDGFNVFASSDVHYDNVFARTSDDCHTIYCTRKGHEGSSTDISMKNSVLWADVAHPIMIGLHGSFDSMRPDSVVNARYTNIDILDLKEKQLDYQGAFAINCGDNNLVKDIIFEDIRVENFRQGRLIDMRICFNKKYCQFPGRGIEDITFKNISYNGNNAELSLIIGYDELRKVKNVVFDNLMINGVKITDDMPGKPKWYKTGDMARIFIGEHVENVTFR